MTETNSQLNEQEIKRYLFAETTDEERQTIEEQLFADDELFFEVVNTENELVDKFAANKLKGEDFTRFERSLELLPARREKVANAVALQTYIAEERTAEAPIVVPAGQTFWQKLGEFFTIKTPAFGYSMAGLLVLFALATTILVLQNGQKNTELARLENERQEYEQSMRRQDELQNEIADLRRSESELQNRIDNEREASGDLTDELAKEAQRRRQAESELEKAKQQIKIPNPNPPPPQPATPTIATIFLKPGIITRDGTGTNLQKLNVASTTRRVAVQFALPADTKPEERFTVQLNEKTIGNDVKARVGANGQKTIQLTVSPDALLDGANKLTVNNAEGKEVGKYYLTAAKK